MVDVDLVTAKLGDLQDRVARVRARRPASLEAFRADRDAIEIVAFNLMLAVQSALDIGSHLIADEGWPVATTLAMTFERLKEHAVISAGTALALGRAAGLRNVLAHGYAGVDLAKVYDAALTGVADLDAFASEVSVYARARSGA